MTLNDLTVNISHLDQKSLLSDWEWLIGPSKFPILVCASGDAFLQDAESGEVFCLDVSSGELFSVADDVDEFKRLLSDKEFVTGHFAVEMIGDLRQTGNALGPGQVYSFKKPLALGGECVLENIEPADIEVHFSIYGQIHEQIMGLSEGEKIEGVKIG